MTQVRILTELLGMAEEYCPVCGKPSETEYRRARIGYVMHICTNCGADKRQDPNAPV